MHKTTRYTYDASGRVLSVHEHESEYDPAFSQSPAIDGRTGQPAFAGQAGNAPKLAIVPACYSPKEGNDWVQWPSIVMGHTTAQLQAIKRQYDGSYFKHHTESSPEHGCWTWHALKFPDGSVFDLVNGFRNAAEQTTLDVGKPMDTVRSTYRELNLVERCDLTVMKAEGRQFINRLVGLRGNIIGVPSERHVMLTTAIRRAEEAVMWATKAITT